MLFSLSDVKRLSTYGADAPAFESNQLAALTLQERLTSGSMAPWGFKFEVFGKVQGVFFRKHTAQRATALGLKGWVMNTNEGTVKGECIGQQPNCDAMKQWLKYEGSPRSRIERAVFTNEGPRMGEEYASFDVRR